MSRQPLIVRSGWKVKPRSSAGAQNRPGLACQQAQGDRYMHVLLVITAGVLLLGVFLAGLMTGRTPELFGRKLETPQVRLLALLVLLQPITLLVFTAITLAVPGLAGTSNPGFHGISQVFYEYVSAYANNGSGFEGLGDATLWWNLSCSLVLLLGRFPLLIIPLVVAAQLAAKRQAPESAGSLQIETPTFALTLVSVIVILTVLHHASSTRSTHAPRPALLDGAGLRRALVEAVRKLSPMHLVRSPVMAVVMAGTIVAAIVTLTGNAPLGGGRAVTASLLVTVRPPR
ncbi:hypothetical protein G6F59_013841 [Rhizopus arrhizus]|nr:hypothetical protein G6F59_013841 [Rhizopus arrhizus]